MSILQEDEDVRAKIGKYLADKGITKKWLATKIPCSQSHLGLILQCQRELTDENLEKVNVLLGTKFQRGDKVSALKNGSTVPLGTPVLKH